MEGEKRGKLNVCFLFLPYLPHSVFRILGCPTKAIGQKRLILLYCRQCRVFSDRRNYLFPMLANMCRFTQCHNSKTTNDIAALKTHISPVCSCLVLTYHVAFCIYFQSSLSCLMRNQERFFYYLFRTQRNNFVFSSAESQKNFKHKSQIEKLLKC